MNGRRHFFQFSIASALGLLGCAQAIKDPAPPEDQFVIPPVMNDQAQFMPPTDSTVPPPPPRMDMGQVMPPPGNCNPGMRLGLCQICSPDGIPVAAPDDPACPDANCSAFDSFMLSVDGQGQVCNRVGRRPTGGNCRPDGECHVGDAVYCDAIDRTEVARADACKTIAGCEGEEGPEVMPAAEGTACPGGICKSDGTCDTTEVGACEDFETELEKCRGGRDIMGPLFCEFVFEEQNCIQGCLELGGFCVRAWSSPGSCMPGEPIGCLDTAPTVLCRCGKK